MSQAHAPHLTKSPYSALSADNMGQLSDLPPFPPNSKQPTPAAPFLPVNTLLTPDRPTFCSFLQSRGLCGSQVMIGPTTPSATLMVHA